MKIPRKKINSKKTIQQSCRKNVFDIYNQKKNVILNVIKKLKKIKNIKANSNFKLSIILIIVEIINVFAFFFKRFTNRK